MMSSMGAKIISKNNHASAFTLIELLTTISIIAVLLAIVVPSYGRVRSGQRELRCLATVRECATATLAYTGEYRDTFPYLSASRTFQGAFRLGNQPVDYDAQSVHWPQAVRASWVALSGSPAQLCPSSEFAREGGSAEFDALYGTIPFSHFGLSYALFTAPSLWARAGRPVEREDLQSTRLGQVLFPSDKAMLIESYPWHRGPQVPIRRAGSIFDPTLPARERLNLTFVDGSAATLKAGDLTPASDDTPLSWAKGPAFSTPQGALGRDRNAVPTTLSLR
jgi:prepilin-type N-terminal cleavage/methylation domain-containing protein